LHCEAFSLSMPCTNRRFFDRTNGLLPAGKSKLTFIGSPMKGGIKMRRFNVTGLCVADKHYMVDISGKLEQIGEMIDNGVLFPIIAYQ